MKKTLILLCILGTVLLSMPAFASQEDLAKATQNPVSDLISLPFQDNMNFGYGPNKEIDNVLNIQPVIPISLNENWNLITRTILPVISRPAITAGGKRKNGVGDLNTTLFFSPKDSGALIWGAGPIFSFPTANPGELGTKKWGIGPSVVVLKMQNAWVYGALINNVWSYAGAKNNPSVNAMTLQPFLNYNFPTGWYLSSSPIITANWKASSKNRWTIPLGGGFGKVFSIGKQPMNAQFQGFYNIKKPTQVGYWTLRLQLQFLFPKG
jgi:hypothetical protein